VCITFAEAMSAYGVPSQVLTDNGKQFTGKYTKPFPAEQQGPGGVRRYSVARSSGARE
jgi:hypothetical protein